MSYKNSSSFDASWQRGTDLEVRSWLVRSYNDEKGSVHSLPTLVQEVKFPKQSLSCNHIISVFNEISSYQLPSPSSEYQEDDRPTLLPLVALGSFA